MSMRDTIDSRARQLLADADFHWSDRCRCFEKGRDPNKQTTEEYHRQPRAQITYGELQRHNLARNGKLEKIGDGLHWLRKKLQEVS